MAPSTQPALQLQPVFRRWLIAARTVAAVHIWADPVACHSPWRNNLCICPLL